MRKWQKVLLICVCTVAVLIALGTIGYRKHISPIVDKKIEQTAEQVQSAVQNETIQELVEKMASDMVNEGVISEDSIPTYVEYAKERSEKKAQISGSTQAPESTDSSKNTDKPKATDMPKVTDAPVKSDDINKVDVSIETKPEAEPEKKKTAEELLMESMTAEEVSFAMSIYSRIDVGHAMSLLETDRAAAKKYIYDNASPDEISRCLEIYAKYAYLLG